MSSVVPFHVFGQAAQTDMQHDSFGHLVLALTSHAADGTVNDTTVFVS